VCVFARHGNLYVNLRAPLLVFVLLWWLTIHNLFANS